MPYSPDELEIMIVGACSSGRLGLRLAIRQRQCRAVGVEQDVARWDARGGAPAITRTRRTRPLPTVVAVMPKPADLLERESAGEPFPVHDSARRGLRRWQRVAALSVGALGDVGGRRCEMNVRGARLSLDPETPAHQQHERRETRQPRQYKPNRRGVEPAACSEAFEDLVSCFSGGMSRCRVAT